MSADCLSRLVNIVVSNEQSCEEGVEDECGIRVCEITLGVKNGRRN